MSTNNPTAQGGRLDIFLLPDAGVRGAHVRLDDAWRDIIARNDDPAAVSELLTGDGARSYPIKSARPRARAPWSDGPRRERSPR